MLLRLFPPALLLGAALPIGTAVVADGAVAQRGGETMPCSYFVAVTGSDGNNGRSATTPFATLEQAQAAARRSSAKVVCLSAGTYHRRTPLNLGAADNGETWQYYPASGVDSAVLDGGGSLGTIIGINAGSSNITINGLKIQNFTDYGIHVQPQGATSDHITIENCDVGNGGHTGSTSGGIVVENTTNALVSNNYVHDMVNASISMYAFNPGETLLGSVVQNNVVLRAATGESDMGAIYTEMLSTAPSSLIIRNNYIRDYGHAGGFGAIGIYLDEGANHVTVTGNIVGPPAEGSVASAETNNTGAAFTNAGHDNTFSGNIVDLGDSGRVFAGMFYGYPAYGESGNVFKGNIIVSNFAGRQGTNMSGMVGFAYFQNIAPASNYTIQDNVYWNYASGGSVFSHGTIASDTNPIHLNPQLSNWTYAIAGTSPVFRPPVNFTPIIGDWGPPGFVVPRTGTRPSSPH